MKLFNKNIFALMAAASLLSACSDDALLREATDLNEESGIVFYVPKVPTGVEPGSTRALGNVMDFNGNEADIKDLRVFAYKDGSNTPICIDLIQDGTMISGSEDGYNGYRYSKELENGEYEMYFVANAPSISNSISKGDLLTATVAVPDNLDGGLPMSCSNADLWVTYGNGAAEQVGTNSTITVEPGGNQTVRIKADLHFAASKVRVTLLNDVRPGDLMGEVKVVNHANRTVLIEGGAAPEGVSSTTVTGKYYSLDPSTIPANENDLPKMALEKKDLAGKEFNPAAGNTQPYIWQTIFYVPERLISSQNEATKLSMKIGNDSKDHILGEQSGSNVSLQRSHFYDYVGLSNGKFQLAVQNWTPLVMSGVLNGEYWLKLEETGIHINAGYKSELRYQTNANDISLSCLKYEGQDIYRFTKSNGVITITLNPEIDREEFTAIKAGDDWRYFTITAGTIVKKVAVSTFDFTEFIQDTTVFTIDVNERKTSGDYGSSRLFTLSTNLNNVRFEKVTWDSAADEGEIGKPGTAPSLQIQDKNGEPLKFDTSLPVEANGDINFRIAYNGLNSDRKLWQKNKDFKLIVKGLDKNGEVVKDESGAEVSCEVYIYVRPSYDTYRIHFYAPGWNHPHIYVYQCLQLPGDLQDAQRRNAPVGYQNTNGQYYAALEYDFTGAVAFQGWYSSQYNQPNNSGSIDPASHFFKFNDGTDWNPSGADFDKHYNRVDFCKGHREDLKTANMCTECTKSGFGMSWPGIHMVPDPDKPANSGWWFFDLSGVADPGKALIMFTDCYQNDHGYKGNDANDWNCYTEKHRYPYKRLNHDNNVWEDMPGIALFDYPSKEGWFVYEGHMVNGTYTNDNSYINSYFYPEDPGVVPDFGHDPTPTPTPGTTYTVYYTTSWSNVHVFYKKDGKDYPGLQWPGKPMTKQSDGRWKGSIPKDAQIVLFNNGNSGKNNQTNDITVVGQDNYGYSGNVYQ